MPTRSHMRCLTSARSPSTSTEIPPFPIPRGTASPAYIRKPSSRTELAKALRFLVPLGVGVAVAYVLVTKLLVGKTESPGFMIRAETAPYCYAFFFGLVLVSIREPWRRIKGIRAGHYALALLGWATLWMAVVADMGTSLLVTLNGMAGAPWICGSMSGRPETTDTRTRQIPTDAAGARA